MTHPPLLAAILALAAWAVEPPPATPVVLENTGKPMVLPFQCTDDDIQWAGLSCSEEEPCPVYIEIAALEPVGVKLFAAGNIHSASVTLYSVLVASDDGGKTWREVSERIRGAGLDHIEFLDFETGWVSGESLFPLPHDPFLLITRDGGKSWRRQPIYADSRPGSIQQFWFASRSDGSLIVDRGPGAEGGRYELYESPNTGDTWMIREANDKPLRLKHAPEPAAGWRIRADAASGSFHIEHRVSERWSAVAAFSVPLATCKPPLK